MKQFRETEGGGEGDGEGEGEGDQNELHRALLISIRSSEKSTSMNIFLFYSIEKA